MPSVRCTYLPSWFNTYHDDSIDETLTKSAQWFSDEEKGDTPRPPNPQTPDPCFWACDPRFRIILGKRSGPFNLTHRKTRVTFHSFRVGFQGKDLFSSILTSEGSKESTFSRVPDMIFPRSDSHTVIMIRPVVRWLHVRRVPCAKVGGAASTLRNIPGLDHPKWITWNGDAILREQIDGLGPIAGDGGVTTGVGWRRLGASESRPF